MSTARKPKPCRWCRVPFEPLFIDEHVCPQCRRTVAEFSALVRGTPAQPALFEVREGCPHAIGTSDV